MKNFILAVFFILFSAVGFCYPTDDVIVVPPGANLIYDSVLGVWRPLAGTASGTLEISIATETAGLQEAIASVTAEVTLKTDEILGSVSTSSTSLEAKIELENDRTLGSISTASTSLESKMELESAKLLTTIATSTSDYTSIETTSVSVTDTSADITALTDRSWITLQNTGANTVYVNIGGTPATTSGYKLVANGSIGIQKIADSVTVSVICDSGESSTVIVVQGAK